MLTNGPFVDGREHAVSPTWSPPLDRAHPRPGQFLGLRLTLHEPLEHEVAVKLTFGKANEKSRGELMKELGLRNFVDATARVVHVFDDRRLGFTLGVGETFSRDLGNGRHVLFNQNRTDIVGDWTGTLVWSESAAGFVIESLGRPGSLATETMLVSRWARGFAARS